ncbi:hypothetical protein J3F84DRAFT_339747 [Trichoderma pleuroticola]
MARRINFFYFYFLFLILGINISRVPCDSMRPGSDGHPSSSVINRSKGLPGRHMIVVWKVAWNEEKQSAAGGQLDPYFHILIVVSRFTLCVVGKHQWH